MQDLEQNRLRHAFRRPVRSRNFSPILKIGLQNYSSVYELQLEKHGEIVKDPSKETIILTEHHPVYTAGRKSREQILPNIHGIPLLPIERGGGITYHGPGQIVGYPILHLEKRRSSIPQYLRQLEESLIEALADFGVSAERRPECLAGLWVGGKKLVSIGIAVRHWVTFHGFALNVDCDLTPFRRIEPCGLSGDKITSMKDLGIVADKNEIKETIKEKLLRDFF